MVTDPKHQPQHSSADMRLLVWLRLVLLLPLLQRGWCSSYTEYAVPKGMKSAIFAGGAAIAR